MNSFIYLLTFFLNIGNLQIHPGGDIEDQLSDIKLDRTCGENVSSKVTSQGSLLHGGEYSPGNINPPELSETYGLHLFENPLTDNKLSKIDRIEKKPDLAKVKMWGLL